MSSIHDTTTDILARRNVGTSVRRLFGLGAMGLDVAAIMAVTFVMGEVYHRVALGTPGDLSNHLSFGALTALVFCAVMTARGDYRMEKYYAPWRNVGEMFYFWTATFLTVFAIQFLTKSSADYSRGSVLLAYAAGFVLIAAVRVALVAVVVSGTRSGRISARRVLVVGREEDVMAFARHYEPWTLGLQVVGTAPIRATDAGDPDLAVDLARAVDGARALRPDSIFVVVPWSKTALIERCVDAFMTVPASIHLAPERVLDRFGDVAISKIGRMASLELTRPPLSTVEILEKRLFDVAAATFGLVLLAPLFLVVAILIKLDGKGPVFFLQRRYGFNQKPFRIVKFRSMRTLDDGAVVRQATVGDPRITKIGAFLRRTNIDELPQLLNVLKGDMSIVGPRPHAVAHNRDYERRIALYARRHNVKPGITGWAQVNGYRGETDTDEKMRGRVEHDLWYIDNWSLLLDIRICLMTVLSRKAFSNAR
jgi:Undecaprenyl-phosphate glucose phosphotransferase